jgi:hypothetical protein
VVCCCCCCAASPCPVANICLILSLLQLSGVEALTREYPLRVLSLQGMPGETPRNEVRMFAIAAAKHTALDFQSHAASVAAESCQPLKSQRSQCDTATQQQRTLHCYTTATYSTLLHNSNVLYSLTSALPPDTARVR